MHRQGCPAAGSLLCCSNLYWVSSERVRETHVHTDVVSPIHVPIYLYTNSKEHVAERFRGARETVSARLLLPKSCCLAKELIHSDSVNFYVGSPFAALVLVIDALRHWASHWVLAQPAFAITDAALCGPVEATAS